MEYHNRKIGGSKITNEQIDGGNIITSGLKHLGVNCNSFTDGLMYGVYFLASGILV